LSSQFFIMTKPKAYYQAYLVIKCLSKEEYSLIPKSLLNEIISKMEKDESIYVDPNIPLEKQKIDEKTYDILDKVITAIERNYGKDAIDNPTKYAKLDSNPVEEIDISDIFTEPVKKEEKKENRNQDRNVKDLENENIRLKGIIKALEEENKKIEKAKEIFEDYKTLISSKDQKIKILNEEVDTLKKNNQELYEDLNKVPKLVRKIFVKDDIKRLSAGNNTNEEKK